MVIGIIGLGTVGFGVADILTKEKTRLEKTINEEVRIKYGCALEKVNLSPDIIYTADYHQVINDPEVNVVVELIGGTTIAKSIILEALNNKKHVVTANKALLAHEGKEIFKTAYENGVHIFYEASVGGGIPVVVSEKEDLIANNISKIEGILNGTTNFILSLMETDNLDFDEALKIANDLGFVEANASLDLDGIDAAHKIKILAMNAYHKHFDFDLITTRGIRSVTKKDMDYAKKLGYRIKLIAKSELYEDSIGIDVSPTLIPLTDIVGNVMGAYNVVEITTDYLENVLYYGKGAGRYVTASAVVSDIIKTHNKELWSHDYPVTDKIKPITKSQYYIRTNKMLNIKYESYLVIEKDHIYITEEYNLKELQELLKDTEYQYFKVRS